MTHTACEMIWIQLLCEMGVATSQPMKMFCDNQTAMCIINNHVFHEPIKHIEVDCHFIQDMIMGKQIVTSYVSSSAQLGDILIKALFCKPFSALCNKLWMIDRYGPT